MKIKTAVKILKHHNRWRRDTEIAPYNPKELGIAMDVIVKYIEKQICYEPKK